MSAILTLISDSKYATLQYQAETQTILLQIKIGYVPLETFKQVIEEIEAFAAREKVSKMIFDKRNLTVFHQPSMEWYHVVWKQRMLKKGLSTYRKLLPNDRLFHEGVKIGREKIQKNNPEFTFAHFDIAYCTSLEEAFGN